ncbi:hypothetical protein PS918_05031 [Pseudomonas fluorescens]|uniref:Uncharacterized protein n=1 Tax=Pseudomonas fluorescens TaxID=294 RepID=A0A5E7UEA2_PSEFL|nr:hypothetical protein PS918_05031 [Pseudomonas fluorescens]
MRFNYLNTYVPYCFIGAFYLVTVYPRGAERYSP